VTVDGGGGGEVAVTKRLRRRTEIGHAAQLLQTDGEHTAVIVQGFAPLLGGPFWRFEEWFHDLVGRRFLARVARENR
jgi:hypothetical protein